MARKFDERNMAKSRAVCEAMAEAHAAGRREPSERERRILEMWPRYEDGEPVMPGDEVGDFGGEIVDIYFDEKGVAIWNNACDHLHLAIGERVKRPVQSVLDADGVEIKKGDTEWWKDRPTEYMVTDVSDGMVHLTYEGRNGTEKTVATLLDRLTHARPDSWERLDEDAMKSMPKYWGCSFEPCDECPSKIDGKTPAEIYGVSSCSKAKELDIIRRAKALAGVGR